MLGITNALTISSAKKQRYALSFDGTNDFVDLGPSNAIIAASQDPVSFSSWVKTTNATGGYVFSCQKGDGSSAFSVNVQANGKPRGIIWNGGSAHNFPGNLDTGSTAVDDGEWHHVAVVAKNNSQKIYVDGSLEAETTGAMDLPTSTDSCSIGAHDSGEGNRFNGSITNLAIFTVELSASAITSIYNAGRHHNLNSPTGNYSSTPSRYYFLGNGLFDDRINGAIHDQNNFGFSSESTFATNAGGSMNGTFNTSDLPPNTYATLSIENNRLKVSPSAGFGYGFARIIFDSAVGDVFLIKVDAEKGNATNTVVKANATSNFKITQTIKSDEQWSFVGYGKALSTSTVLRLQVTGADGVYGYFDNLSIIKLNGEPGVVSGATFVKDN